MKQKAALYMLIAFTLLAGFASGLLCSRIFEEDVSTAKTDTITKYDTLTVVKPVAKDSIVERYVTRWLPAAQTQKADNATAIHAVVGDSVAHADIVANNIPPDSLNVIVPISQKEYETEDYKAWVSGYEASLDSIRLYKKTEIVTSTIYTEKQKRRWGLSIGIGGGINHKGEVTPVLGIMFGYKIL